MTSPLDDQRAAAAADLDGQTASLRANAVKVTAQVTPEQVAWFTSLLNQATPCEHLVTVPVQPTYTLLGTRSSVAECRACFMGRTEELRECSWCGRDADLCPVVSESGHRLAIATVCGTCRAGVLALFGAHTA